MRDMEERGVEEERELEDEDEIDVILVSEEVCVCERESVCVFTQSIDSFFTEFKSNRVLK